ncbi:SBBP repeat-containing protein [Leptospira alstonii]|uniref:SBBP repeat-containing protein n=1 Tax=Leptospira alstonii TaxID=28452 RepID=UPI001E647641|nr:SBBP repeat-containing protein [Leptospira alstonii]
MQAVLFGIILPKNNNNTNNDNNNPNSNVPNNNSGTKQWTRLLGAAGATTLSPSITSDSLGNVYTIGHTDGNLDGQILTGTNDLFVVKYNNAGTKQWTRLLGVAGALTYGRGSVTDGLGNIYITGETYGNLDGQIRTGLDDLYVVKYDNAGTKQWTRLLGVAGATTRSFGITSDSLGNMYLAGFTNGNLDGQILTGTNDLFVVKYDNAGTKQWTRLLGVAAANTQAYGITSDSLGNIYITGFTDGNLDGQIRTGNVDLFVVKYNNAGTKQWTRLLGTAGTAAQAYGIVSDALGNVFSTGSTNGNLDGQIITGNTDLFVVKYNNAGTRQWTRLLGAAGATTQAWGIASDSLGNVYPGGSADGNLDGQVLTGNTDLLVVKYDNAGTKQWTRLLGVAGATTGAAAITSDNLGNVYPTGNTDGNLDGQILTGNTDLLVVQYR